MIIRGKATSIDIAYRAGVSQSTVSRALRGSPLVGVETRKRIESLAKELNYKVDKNASSLRRQHSGTIALLLFEDPTADASQINPFFLSMLGSITRGASRRGYDLLISFQQLSDDWHADYQDSNKADGIILLGYGDYLAYRGKLEKLVASGTHFARWGAVQADQPGISIGCDNFQGGTAMTAHLLKQGRQRIAFLGTTTPNYPEFFERYRGYANALDVHGLSVDPALQVEVIDSTEQAGFEAARILIDRDAKVDAVFAASDLIAIGAMRAFADAGQRVPEDVAMAGFDDIPMASFCSPPLTTVRQDTQLAGDLLVQSVIRQIERIPTTSAVLPANLIIRRSCGADA